MEKEGVLMPSAYSEEIPFWLYKEKEGMSASDIKLFATSETPLHYKTRKKNHLLEKKSISLGKLAHALILEPGTFHSQYQIIDDEIRRGTKAWESIKKEGLHPIKKSEFDAATEMAKEVFTHPLTAGLLNREGFREESIFWNDGEGLKYKARLDFRCPALKIIIDLKTTHSADPISKIGFAKSVWTYRYDLQAAHYLEGVKALTGEDYDFLFAAVEQSPPYAVSVSLLNEEDLERARREMLKIRKTLFDHTVKDSWYGWKPKLFELQLPRYATQETDIS